MRRYDYILFDADNTLFDFNQAEYLAFKETTLSSGLLYSDELCRTYSVINDGLWKQLERKEISLAFLKVERFRSLLVSIGYPENNETYEKGVAMCEKYVASLSEQGCLVSDAAEVCRKLSKYYSLYIITNGISSIQRSRMKKTPLDGLFRDMFISEEMGVAKPSKEYFDRVLQTVGCDDKSRYLVVGDSLTSDCDGAIAYGLDICRYNPENKSNDGRKLTYNITKLTELYDILGVEDDG